MSERAGGDPWDTDSWAALTGILAADLERSADRLRSLSQPRLAAAAPPYASRAAAARALAQLLADAACGLESREDPDPPAWRRLPELGDLSAGDQVAVTGHDLVAAAAVVTGPHEGVWARHGRSTAHEVVTVVTQRLAELRTLL